MRPATLTAAVLATVLFMSAANAADANVRFVNPERYTDADWDDRRGSYQPTIAFFRTYIMQLAGASLAPGQQLTIDVLNIDLAGSYEPWRGNPPIRVLRGATAPSFTLRYVLKERGRQSRSGEETLTDFNYQSSGAGFASDRFAYEKSMLRDWFRRRIANAGG